MLYNTPAILEMQFEQLQVSQAIKQLLCCTSSWSLLICTVGPTNRACSSFTSPDANVIEVEYLNFMHFKLVKFTAHWRWGYGQLDIITCAQQLGDYPADACMGNAGQQDDQYDMVA